VQIPNQLIEFSVQSVTGGIDALGTVTIRLRHQERIFSGQASDTDIVVAAALRSYERTESPLSILAKADREVAVSRFHTSS
jgi:hypothetical protein